MSGEPVTCDPRPTAAPPLAYADSSLIPGFCLIREKDRIIVVVPPAIRRRAFSRQLLFWVLLLMSIVDFVFASLRAGRSLGDSLERFADAWPLTLGFLVLLLRWVNLSRRRMIFEFTAAQVSLRFEHSIFPWKWEPQRWPLPKVHEIRFSTISGKLVLRIAGADLRQFYLGPDAAQNRFIGDQLSAALSKAASLAPSAESEPDAVKVLSPVQRRRRLRWRMGVAYVAAAIAVCGLMLMPWSPFGLLLVLVSGAIAGITVGTQPRDFYA